MSPARRDERGDRDAQTEETQEEVAEPSPLEADFSSRANQTIQQFGYDIMRQRRLGVGQSTGALHDSYQLGVGDQILVTLHGQEWHNVRTPVDRSGRIILPRLPPIEALGRTLGEVRALIRTHVKSRMLGTDVHVTIGDVRSVDVTVIGEVAEPGLYHQPGLSSLVDTLILAGGPNKNGSLRNIRIHRGNTVRTVDLYDLFIHGRIRQDLTMREGDIVAVPLIGPTVALTGHVKRQGVYELPAAGGAPLLRDVLRYAGGAVRPRGNRYIRISVAEDGRETVREHRRLASLRARDGDVVIVQPGANIQLGWVTLEGEVRVPGKRSLGAAHTVGRMIGDVKKLGRAAYLPFAVVRRLDAITQAPIYLPVNLLNVVANRDDLALQPADTVIVFHRKDIEFLHSADVQAILAQTLPPSLALTGGAGNEIEEWSTGQPKHEGPSGESDSDAGRRDLRNAVTPAEAAARFIPQLPGAPRTTVASPEPGAFARVAARGLVRRNDDETLSQTEYACAGLRMLSALLDVGSSERFANARRILSARREAHVVNVVQCPRIYDRFPAALAFILDNVVAVDGEVLVPGIYPVAGETGVRTMARIAGGLTREADLSNVEISRVAVSRTRGTADFRRSIHDLSGRADDAGDPVVAVGPGDSVRFNRVFTQREEGPVLLTGEFRRPGTYRIQRGERLSQIIARAGGLTEQAYPFGAVFLRESARLAQKTAIDRQANQLQNQLFTAFASRSKAGNAAYAASNRLLERLRDAKPFGRVMVEADPTVLEIRPEKDIIVVPGDHLIVPKRPATVHVNGAVLNPGSMQFDSQLNHGDYIRIAGGFDGTADVDRVFVVLPNGKAKRIGASYWNFERANISPGSTIVVPRNITPFEIAPFLIEATSVLSRIAITAASLATIVN